MARPHRGHWLQLPAQAVPQLEQVLVAQAPQPLCLQPHESFVAPATSEQL